MQGLRLAWSKDNTVSESLKQRLMDAEKIYIGAATSLAGTRKELTQMFQVVFAALVHAHCSLKAPHPLARVASRCHFVDSSYGPEKTAQLQEHNVSIFQSALCFCLSI